VNPHEIRIIQNSDGTFTITGLQGKHIEALRSGLGYASPQQTRAVMPNREYFMLFAAFNRAVDDNGLRCIQYSRYTANI
jgi:hypothetical protein